jgi:hypothetical protein
MDSTTLMIIAIIIVLIFVLDVYKRQNDKITSNLHADNLKQLLTISALEYKFKAAINTEAEPQLAVNEITQLINRYEHGEIPTEAFQNQMDYLLNKYN